MKEITILRHQRLAIINKLDNNLSKQKELANKANSLRVELVGVCNKIFDYNSKVKSNG